MPILPISTSYPLPINSFITRAIMFHPDNELHRNEYAAVSICKAIDDDDFSSSLYDENVGSIQDDSSTESELPETSEDEFESLSDMMKAYISKSGKSVTKILEEGQQASNEASIRFSEQYRKEHPSIGNLLINSSSLSDSDFIDHSLCAKILLHTPPYEELEKRASKNSMGGSIAGDILLNLYQQKNIGLNPSIRKAYFVLERAYMRSRKYSMEHAIPMNITSFKKRWTIFKPVSHLWAALKLIVTITDDNIEEHYRPLEEKDYSHIFNTETFNNLLASAEFLRRFGEKIISEKVKRPIFNKDELWRVPKNYPLPKTELSITEVDDWLQKTLEDYYVLIG